MQRHYKYEAIAGGTSLLFILLTFCFSGIVSVTGDKSILICDMYGQYYEFLLGIKHIILQNKSLVYSWNLDMGIGIIGWIAYYVTSPFNVLLLVVPDSWMIGAVTVLILIKLALSAVAFVVFMRKAFHMYGPDCVIGALCYSMNSFAVTYFFNIMWLDILIWLPLLAVATKKLVDEGNSRPFYMFLSLAFFSNYYMSYMTGIFLFTCFVAYYIYAKGTICCIEFSKCFFRFLSSAVLSFGICGILLIPAVFQMVERLGEGSANHENGVLGFSMIEFIQGATIGSFTSLKYGKPLVYCSCLFLLLVLTYFGNKRIRRRERYCLSALIICWFIIMLIPETDLLMHIGNNPTWFPYRYAFVFCFLLCIAGTRQLHDILECAPVRKFLGITAVLIVILVTILMLSYLGYVKAANMKGLALSIFYILLYGLFFGAYKRKADIKREMVLLLGIIVVSELIFNGMIIYKEMDNEYGFRSAEEIYEKQELVKEQLKSIKGDTAGVRIEKNYRVGYNDGMAFGYNGISSFSSVYNKGVHAFLSNMGVVNELWNSSYEGSTLFTDSILGIKYILHTSRKSMLDLSTEKTDYIEENDMALPIAFMANERLADYQLENRRSMSAMEKQKELLWALTGKEESKECFKSLKPDSIVLKNAKRTIENGQIVIKSIDKKADSSILYRLKREQNEASYFYPQFDYKKDATKYVEVDTGFKKSRYSRFSERSNLRMPYNISLFDSPDAKEDWVELKLLKNETVRLDKEQFYSIDKECYKKYFNKLKENELTITEWQDGFVKGNIETYDENQIMVVTIPYSKNWNIHVDGKGAEVVPLCGGAWMGVKLQAGTHSIEAFYKEKGVATGIFTSILCIIGILCWSIEVKRILT